MNIQRVIGGIAFGALAGYFLWCFIPNSTIDWVKLGGLGGFLFALKQGEKTKTPAIAKRAHRRTANTVQALAKTKRQKSGGKSVPGYYHEE